ncbi:MAG: hypothetical protein E7630_01995 [Ruminococcaceae bacterium]|nr:hypothetical protein [Oscillospiraceae bacterium]
MKIIVKNIRLPLSASEREVLEQAALRLAPFVSKQDILSRTVFRRSVDTRHKTVSFVYSVAVETEAVLSEKQLERLDCALLTESDPTDGLIPGEEPSENRPVVVGFGPCGMFAALMLAEAGYRPIVLERGDGVMERTQKVGAFFRDGILDPNSNIQFGAGGAGTFSDGKLVTRIHDGRARYVLRRLAEYGAPREILVNAKPHIGTDRLLGVVSNIDARIRHLGGEIRYHTRLEGFRSSLGRITAVLTNEGEIPCGQVLLAIGHSARDTYAMLSEQGVLLTPKPFSVGVRIEHLQADIDRAVYRDLAGHPKLGPAEYALSRRQGEDCVYTFCMCPGGEVIAAASEEGGVVTNGMSRYRRDGKNANAALVVSVAPEDPIAFQRQLEHAAFAMGGGDYSAPVQTVGDFLAGKHGTEPSRILPTYRKGAVRTADLSALFPARITSMLKLGLADFDRKLHGFASPDALLTGAETRTSSPVRILRSDALTASGFDNLYPCGEGAGYAGGITSAAVDGLRAAEAVIRRFAPYEG